MTQEFSGFAGATAGSETAETAGPAGPPDVGLSAALPLRRVHQAVTNALAARVAGEGAEAFALSADVFEEAGNVVGVAVGPAPVEAQELLLEPGSPTVTVYLAEPMPHEHVRRILADEMGVEDAADPDLPLRTVVTGQIEALSHTFRIRPAPGGVSVGRADSRSAGTLGCLVRRSSGDEPDRLLILTNNHVIADVNAGQFGDPIVQPGRLDGGSVPGDQIAALERFVRIDFSGGENLVDCATAWADPEQVRPDIVYLRDGRPQFFRVSSQPLDCRENLLVGKSGRTTQLTSGDIESCTATVTVRFGDRTALFVDQIAVRGRDGDFSRPGDSGSLVWSLDEERRPVGLLFAGGRGRTFVNKIGHVLTALDVEIVA